MSEQASELAGTWLVEPWDEHNRRWVGHVHPADWVNPEPAERYNLVVVGAGPAGLVCAASAAGLGARVALVERRLMGGDCLNFGCVPSKALIRAARAWHEARHGAAFGAPVATGEGDFAAVMARMRRLRADVSPADGVERFRSLGVDVFLGDARFMAADAVEVAGQRLRFARAVVATGGRPALPAVPGLAEAGALTHETVFSLTELPARLLVLGGGPVGCELAQAFARFGSRVTLVQRGPQLLPREDEDAAALVRQALERDGVELLLGATVERVERSGSARVVHLHAGGAARRLEAEQLLVATGRTANVEGLGLEAAGVEYEPAGVRVDDNLRTTNRRIFALGDVASSTKFTHLAEAQARIVLRNALFPLGRARTSDLVVPRCTYTVPEVAHVGLSRRQAQERGLQVEELTLHLADNDRARLDGQDEGFLRVLHLQGKDRILGATLVADHAGDLISELTLAITHRLGLRHLSATIHPYPTQAEIIKRAGDAWFRCKLTPGRKGLLERFFGWMR